MKLKKITVKLTEPMLGTKPLSAQVASDYLQSKAKDAEGRPKPTTDEEKAARAAEELLELERQCTIFYRMDDGTTPFIYDYQILGFLKEACGSLRRADAKAFSSPGLKAYKTAIESVVFVMERRVPITIPEGSEITITERPLRSQTPKGVITSLARSETVPPLSTLSFTILVLNDQMNHLVDEWLEYGTLRGIGQWRTGSNGRFVVVGNETSDISEKEGMKLRKEAALARLAEQQAAYEAVKKAKEEAAKAEAEVAK